MWLCTDVVVLLCYVVVLCCCVYHQTVCVIFLFRHLLGHQLKKEKHCFMSMPQTTVEVVLLPVLWLSHFVNCVSSL